MAGLGGGEAAEGRAELDGCPEVTGALAMPGEGTAEAGGRDAAGGPAEVDGSREAAALAELGAGFSVLALAGASRRTLLSASKAWRTLLNAIGAWRRPRSADRSKL